jgi:hypothetical protein
VGRCDIEVLDVDPVHPAPGGEVAEPQRAPHNLAGVLGDVTEQRGCGREQRGVQLIDRESAVLRGALVLGELVHQRDDRGDVLRPDLADHRSTAG